MTSAQIFIIVLSVPARLYLQECEILQKLLCILLFVCLIDCIDIDIEIHLMNVWYSSTGILAIKYLTLSSPQNGSKLHIQATFSTISQHVQIGLLDFFLFIFPPPFYLKLLSSFNHLLCLIGVFFSYLIIKYMLTLRTAYLKGRFKIKLLNL